MLFALDPVAVWPVATSPQGAPPPETPTAPPNLDDSPEFYYDSIGDNFDSIVASEGTPVNCLNDTTYDTWDLESEYGWLAIDLGSNANVDYLAIAQHNLIPNLSIIALEYWSGGTWNTAGVKIVTSSGPQIIDFTQRTADKFRFQVWAIAPFIYPSIGVIKMGSKLIANRKIYQGHQPARYNEITRLYNKANGGNNYSGQIQETRSLATSIELTNLTSDWVRSDARLLRRHISGGRPFFFRWRPDTYPEESIYCWSSGDIDATNSGPKDLMSWSVNVEALA